MRLSKNYKVQKTGFVAPQTKVPAYPISLTPNNTAKLEEIAHSLPVKSDDLFSLSHRVEALEKDKNIDVYLQSLQKLTEKIEVLKNNNSKLFSMSFQQLVEKLDTVEKQTQQHLETLNKKHTELENTLTNSLKQTTLQFENLNKKHADLENSLTNSFTSSTTNFQHQCNSFVDRLQNQEKQFQDLIDLQNETTNKKHTDLQNSLSEIQKTLTNDTEKNNKQDLERTLEKEKNANLILQMSQRIEQLESQVHLLSQTQNKLDHESGNETAIAE